MKIVVAPQAFKGTATAVNSAEAMRRGVRRVLPDAEIMVAPIADGGGGTVEALVTATNGKFVTSPARDPLGRRIQATWGVLGDGETAVIETAAASGLSLLSKEERDPTVTTSAGTGDLIRAVLDAGYRQIMIGLGDSATNDAGVGLASALGVRALNANGGNLPPGGAALHGLARFDFEGVHTALSQAAIIALCDVTNPLCGTNGASSVYGPQKGATKGQVQVLDAALSRFADVVEMQRGRAIHDFPGAGAAGGLGAGLVALCGAELRPGFETVSAAIGLDAALDGAVLVLTGEGRLDAQTSTGKGVAGVAALVREHGVGKVIAIVGEKDLEQNQVAALGLDEVYVLESAADSAAGLADATLRLIEGATVQAMQRFIRERG